MSEDTRDQQNLFDLNKGRELKRAGMALAAGNNKEWLVYARAAAERIARKKGTVTADDVRKVLYQVGIKPTHPNAWGSVFRGRQWVPTGERVQSKVPSRHANEIRVWRLR